MNGVLPTALVGFGNIAEGYSRDTKMSSAIRFATHAQVLKEHPRFSWNHVVDARSTRLGVAARDWGIQNLALDCIGLPGRESIEALVLATPPESSARLDVLDAFPNLGAVMVEKPLGVDRASSERFLAACATRNILVQVNLTRRGDSTVQELASGGLYARIGRVQAAFGVYGNGLINNGTHIVDLVRLLLGEVESVRASGDERGHFVEGPIAGDVNLPFTLRLTTGLEVSFAPLRFEHYRENGLELWGEGGRLSYLNGGLSVRMHGVVQAHASSTGWQIEDTAGTLLPVTLGHAMYSLYTNLAECVEKGGRLQSSGESALQTAAVIDAILRSAKSGGCQISCAGSELASL
jgi:predicted dehydrogenase